jgi:hypothetical protein
MNDASNEYQVLDMPINGVLDYLSGNSGLTAQAIYRASQKQGKRYAVLSSSTDKDTEMGEIPLCTIDGKTIKVFENKEGLLVIRKGKAGKTRFLPKGDYTINDDAYILYVKDDCPYKISLKWLRLQYRQQFLEYASSSDNGTWNMTGFFKNVKIDISSYEKQLKIVSVYELLEQYENQTLQLLDKINRTSANQLAHTYSKYQANDVPISHVIGSISGNSGLTELFIYQKSQYNGKKYTVLSSSTEENTKMGEIPMCELNGKPLNVFENNEGLLVIRNGKAGTTKYLPKGDYTINDHAYILYVLKDCPYKISLKWLRLQYRQQFLEYASSSDNGTWNMTGFFQNTRIDIPAIEEQLAVEKIYTRLETIETKLRRIDSQINQMFSKVISEDT